MNKTGAPKGQELNLSKIIGGGYEEYWHDRHFFRVVKGGRGSKKSSNAFTEAPYRIMKYPGSNIVIVRQTANTHETSTFAEIQKGVKRLHAEKYWKFTLNPCEATYLPTKQKILFRGFDDPLKLTSLNVPNGVICWAYIEEAYEVDDVVAFTTFCEGIRGKQIEDLGLWPQVTLIYNPWVLSHWTKQMFWDVDRPDTFRLTTTHWCNEWLTQDDHNRIEALNDPKSPTYDPDRYLVVGLGEYGIPGGAFFDEFRRDIHVCKPFPIPDDWRRYVTIDYGRDKLAAYWIAVDWHDKAYVYREIHKPGLYATEAAELIRKSNVDSHGREENIYQWFAPSDLDNKNNQTGKSTLDILREAGLPFVKVSNRKVDGCVNMHEWLRPYEDEQHIKTAPLMFFSTCTNVINALASIQCDEKDPNVFAGEPHELTHSTTAIMYFTAGRPRGGKKPEAEKYPINSLEYRIEKNLDRLTKKTRRECYW